jgi:predicted flap endonuclease-1-like 5' DNA nuclease
MIEGIGETYETKLKQAGISSVEGLLEACASKKGRKELADKSGVTEAVILKWANHADLARIKGIGGEYAEILEAAGVDTVPELAHRKAENLLAQMVKVNEEKKLVRKLPALSQLEDWIKQAAALPRILQY